jgi:hypothetical protein
LREHSSAPPNCILSDWEQAIVDGGSPVVVLSLFNSKFAGCDAVIALQSSFRKVRAAEFRRSETIRAFHEINRLISKWSDRIPEWTLELAI